MLGAIGLTLAFASALGAQVDLEPTTEDQHLTASDGELGDRFGFSVAIDGDTIVIGAPGDFFDSNEGAAYVFTRTDDAWIETQTLTASDGQDFDHFGNSVAIEGDTIVVGASSGEGAAYIFTRADNTWTETQQLTPPDGQDFGGFASSVAIDGDTIVIGAPFSDSPDTRRTGAATVFTRADAIWSQTQVLASSDGQQIDWFGFSVAIDGDTIVIGAPNADTGLNGERISPGDGGTDRSDEGAAYIYTNTNNTWTEQQKLIASDGQVKDFFGSALAIDGDTVVIGATGFFEFSSSDSGAAYIFTRNDNTWTQTQRLSTNDSGFTLFGFSVAIDSDTAIVGALFTPTTENVRQASYVYERTEGTWNEVQVVASDQTVLGDFPSQLMAIDGDTLVVGSPNTVGLDDTDVNERFGNGGGGIGAADVFELDLPQPQIPLCGLEAVTVDLATGDTPTDGDDVILGTDGDDIINAGAGNDIICSQGGNNTINGGAGADLIFGADGDDVIDAGQGRDVIFGGGGADTLTGGRGDDEILGGSGADTISAGNGRDEIFGGPGSDVLIGGNKNDRVNGDEGDDTIDAGKGNDFIDGDEGDDTIDAGLGDDLVRAGDGADVVDGGRGADNIFGGIGADIIRAGKGSDWIDAGAGDDTVRGGSGNDGLDGRKGNDLLRGGGGDDRLNGGRNDDTLMGGSGDDILDGGDDEDVCKPDPDGLDEFSENCELDG